MSLTDSNMLALGTTAPTFHLPFPMEDNNVLDFPECVQKVPVVVMFICNHCPYVKHILPKLVEITKLYQKQNIQFIAINSNDVTQHEEDSYDNMKVRAKEKGFTMIDFFLDSLLVVEQLNQRYKIKDKGLQKQFVEVWNRKQDFKKISFTHIPREQNSEADAMVNAALDDVVESSII